MAHSEKLERVYEHLWDAHRQDSFAALDQPQDPRGPEFLFHFADRAEVVGGDIVVDVGCGRGRQAVALASRYDANVVAIDPLERHLTETQCFATENDVSDRLHVAKGTADALPLGDNRAKLLWCRDVLEHVNDVYQAFAECHRVLQPDGHLLLHSAFATERLEAREEARLRESLGFGTRSLDRQHAEECIARSGFDIVDHADLGGEFAEYYELRDGRCSREMLRLARLLRNRERYERLLGAEAIDTAIALYEWTLGQLLGKVAYHAWLLRKNDKPG